MEFKNFEPDLSKVISNYYDKGMYKESIKQIWLYFKKYVNDEFGIDDDGTSLVGKMFDVNKDKTPLILINKYESSSDIDEQKGFSFLMRWFVSSIRNLESHEFDFEITKEEASAILNFLDIYVFGRLKKHEENSLITDWFEFISTDGFNDTEEYIEKILKVITKNQKKEILFGILDNISLFHNSNRRQVLIENLYNEISKSQRMELFRKIERKISEYNNEELLMFFNNFPCEIWKNINEIISMKIEHKIYLAIMKANEDWDPFEEAYILLFIPDKFLRLFSNKEKVEKLLIEKIKKSDSECKFVFEYFSEYIQSEILNNNDFLINEIKELLSKGMVRAKALLRPILFKLRTEEKYEELMEEYDNFNEQVDIFADFLE